MRDINLMLYIIGMITPVVAVVYFIIRTNVSQKVLEGKIETNRKMTESGFDAMETKLGALKDMTEARFNALESKTESRFSALEEKIEMNRKMTETRFAVLEDKFRVLSEDVGELKDDVKE